MGTSIAHWRNRPRRFMPFVIFVLVLSAAPMSVFGEDEQSIAALRRMGKAFASIAEKASPAVVGIKATRTVRGDSRSRYSDPSNPFGEEFFEYFFRRRAPRRNQEPQPKEVAVVKIDAGDLPYVELADSNVLEVGEWVIAIGNPFGLSHTVTAGIVSAKGRNQIGVANYEDFIQTDAAINFGNSGGPLLNLDGKAVGINTAIIGPGGNVGIGLAIPISMAKVVYEQLKESGKVVRGYLGVEINDLEPGMGEFFGAQDSKGVVVMRVLEDSAAAKAGVKANDIVVEIEREPVANINELMNRVAMHKPGSKVELVIMREGKRRTFTITLDKRPQDGGAAGGGGSKTQEQLGLSVQALTPELAERLGYEGLSGVVVMEVEPGSLADEYGLEPELLITEVNREPVRSVRQFNEALAKAKERGKVLLRVRNEEHAALVLIPLSK